MIQSSIRFLFKVIIQGVVISFVVASFIIAMEVMFGNEVDFFKTFVDQIAYYCLYGVTLTLVNSAYFNYLNHAVVWVKYGKYRFYIAALGSVSVTMIAIFFLRLLVNVGINGESFDVFIAGEKLKYYVISLLITMVISLFFHAIYFYKKSQENKVKEQRIIAGTAAAKFESLKNQIDPHFLFNSLNVLSSLIEENPVNAQKFTASLSKIYRYVLEQKDKELVSVEEELLFAKTYMDLLKMRFEDSLFYEVVSVPSNQELKVVPLSLQLLLENTVKHNVVSENRPLHIKIYIDGNYLVVENNLQKKEVLGSGQGIGLQNIINRYQIITKRKVVISSTEELFSVKIPVLTKLVDAEKINAFGQNTAYIRARKRVEELKAFYGNLIAYCCVIPILVYVNLTFMPKFQWFWFSLVGWGFGLSLHAFKTFAYNSNWEQRKIKQILNKEINNQKWM